MDALTAEPESALLPLDEGATDDAQPVGRAAIDDAPIRLKVALLCSAAAVLGAVVGTVESVMNYATWPLIAGLSATVIACSALGHRWIAVPLEALLHRVELLGRVQSRGHLKHLPTQRRDELGRLARGVHAVAAAAIRDHYEARQLRRTLDAKVQLATRQATVTLQNLAMKDPLTELGNRRSLDATLPPLFEASRSSGSDLICVVIDLDNFKAVNDTLGHAAGDELLLLLGALLKGGVRHEDVAVRLGGDEFAVFLPGGTLRRADEFAEQLRKHFLVQHKAMHPAGPHANLSIGISSLRHDGCTDANALLHRADTRLYEAKREGKGRTVAGNIEL